MDSGSEEKETIDILEDIKDVADTGKTAIETGIEIGTDIIDALPTERRCSVEMKNDCSKYTLCNLRVYTERGQCLSAFPETIKPSAEGKAQFDKTKYTATGCAGIFTYDLLNNSTNVSNQKIAIMYKVPFNLNIKSNQYALGVFNISTECNRDLFSEMAKNTNTTFVRGKAKGPSLTYKSDTVTIMATMSDCYTPTMKVEVKDN